jgi:two-component system OmpR family sensor kinase
LIADSLLVAAGMVVILLVAGSPWGRDHLPPLQTAIALTVLAGAVSLVVTVLWFLVARFSHDSRPAWGASAFAVYGLIAVPATTVGSAVESGRAASGAARFTGHVLMAVMLLVACAAVVRELRVRGRRVADGTVLAVALALPVVAAMAALVAPEAARAVTSNQLIRWGVVGVWLLAAAVHAYQGLSRGISPMYRSGLGILVIALAHSYRVGTEPAQAGSAPGLTFSALRLFGVLLVFWGAYELARRAVRGIRDALIERQEEVLVAEDGLARRAVLNHEIRNGIAGIAGATELLSSSAGTTEQAALQTVVTAELTRLDELLKPDQQ